MKIDGEFSAFSIPYVIPTIKKPKEIYKLLYVIPFSLIYFPIYSITAIIGFAIGIARYRSLERGGRAW